MRSSPARVGRLPSRKWPGSPIMSRGTPARSATWLGLGLGLGLVGLANASPRRRLGELLDEMQS